MTRDSGRRYTFVTVVFEQEYDLLSLQARSFRIHCPHDLVSAILVIDNSEGGLPDATWGGWLAEYGDLAGFVRLVRAASLGLTVRERGWRSQQVLKLLVASMVETERYVVLDAKNHLVTPLGRHHLETPDGRARMTCHGYRRHPMRPYLERVLAVVGLDPEPLLDRFTQTATPFIMYSSIVRQMMSDVSGQHGFEALFIERGLSEFFLYSAYVMKGPGSLEALYALDSIHPPVIWQDKANVDGCRSAIAESDAARAPFFAVHRRALSRLDRRARTVIADFWAERGLFASRRAASDFIRDYQTRFSVPMLTVASEWTVRAAKGARNRVGTLLRRVGLR